MLVFSKFTENDSFNFSREAAYTPLHPLWSVGTADLYSGDPSDNKVGGDIWN